MCWPKGESGKLWLKRPKMAFQAKISFLVSLLFDDGGVVMANEKSRRDVSLTKSIFTAQEQQCVESCRNACNRNHKHRCVNNLGREKIVTQVEL